LIIVSIGILLCLFLHPILDKFQRRIIKFGMFILYDIALLGPLTIPISRANEAKRSERRVTGMVAG
jgi:hypothetical protein